MTTPLLQYVTWFDRGGEIVGFGCGSYKESQSRCSLFVGFPSLLAAPSGEQLALPMCGGLFVNPIKRSNSRGSGRR